MSTPKSEFLKVILDRGYLHQCTDWEGLDALMAKQSITAYIGFDATATSLHVGNMVQIMLLRRLQQTGHKPIALMGGGTTKVGDPSGKDESRRLLSVGDINGNIDSIKQCFASYLTFGSGKTDAIMVNNADWLDTLNYIEFLRDYGRHFSVNRMLSFDSVKLRLEREQPLTFLEFNYMILQAYDFLELARRQNCRLQMGGSDQWGNIVNGTELGRRVDNKELFGLTAPLITTASGAKMGKTAAGAVWLNPARLSPYDYWQYWRNTEDADVGRFLRLFTDLPLGEVARLERLQGSEINDAKIVLANEATTLCHGAPAARNAAETARRTFVEGGLGQDLPSIEVERIELEHGIPVHEVFRLSGLASSNSDARKKIQGRGARLNDVRVDDENYRITTKDLTSGGLLKLSIGGKKHAVLRPTDNQNAPFLLVKRNNGLRENIRKRLKETGYSVFVTTSPGFALKFLENNGTIKVVCIDYHIPGSMSGAHFREIARNLRFSLAYVLLLNEKADLEAARTELGLSRDTIIIEREENYTSAAIAEEMVQLLGPL